MRHYVIFLDFYNCASALIAARQESNIHFLCRPMIYEPCGAHFTDQLRFRHVVAAVQVATTYTESWSFVIYHSPRELPLGK